MRRAGISFAGLAWLAGAAVVAAAVAGGGCSACGGKKRQTRTSDAAPVELVSAAALADAGAGRASDVEEHEPNDGVDVATALAPGSSARGRIEPDTDVDYYRIEVAQAGGLAVTLGAVPGVDLTLELEDAGGTPLAKSDRGAAGVGEGVPNLGVSPGRYTAIVRKKVTPVKKPVRPKKGAPPPPEPPPGSAPEYKISAQVAPFGKNAEHEPDDDRGTANEVIIKETVTGYVGWSGDADVWKVSVEALTDKNLLDIELAPLEGVALAVELADGLGQTIALRKAPRGAGLVIRGLSTASPQGASPYRYVIVRAADRANSNPEAPYQLRVDAPAKGVDAELEPNDSPDKAMVIDEERAVIRDASWTPGDVDCYAIPSDPSARTLEVTVDTPQEADLRLELLVNGKSIATADQKGKGAREKISGAVPASGRPVVCVRGSEASQEGRYSLAFHNVQPKP